jgi:hypothetical protein
MKEGLNSLTISQTSYGGSLVGSGSARQPAKALHTSILGGFSTEGRPLNLGKD